MYNYWREYELSYSVSIFHTLPKEIAMNILSAGILSLVFSKPETEEEKKYAGTDMVLFGGLYYLNYFNPVSPSQAYCSACLSNQNNFSSWFRWCVCSPC